jgi:hypothetical protein
MFKFLEKLNKNDASENKLKKTYITECEDLMLSSKAKQVSEQVNELAKNLLKACKEDYSGLLAIIQSGHVKIIVTQNLKFPMEILGYEEGLIPSHCSIKAFLLSIFIKLFTKSDIKISFVLPDLFITSKKKLEFYFLAHQFYHFLAYKNNLPGYDYKTFSLFTSLMHTKNISDISFRNMSLDRMLALKDIIERDKEAIDFVQIFAREHIGAKNCVDDILSGKTVSI